MNLKCKQITATIKIINFPSRNEVISFFTTFLPQNTSPEDYKIINKSNQILIILKDHNLAYNFTEKFNQKILEDPLYSRTECILSFQKLQRSSSNIDIRTKNYPLIKSKLYEQKTKKKNNYNPSRNDCSLISDYERVHWSKIRDKACYIENDSPYIDNQTKEYLEKKINEKRWVNKKNFNVFVGKASSVSYSNLNEIKNYVRKTPSLPPVLYQFRVRNKNKWIGKKDFFLY
jgi:hypothetical protein